MRSRFSRIPVVIITLAIIAVIAIIGSLTLLGGQVSEVFVTINSGLGGGDYTSADDAVESAPAATAAPMAEAAGEREEVEAADGTAPMGAESVAAERRPEGQITPLKAGEIDDNEAFQDYLAYLRNYQDRPAREADVSERYLITVMNEDQRPLLDAQVRIYADDQQIFSARTYAGGRTIFHPRIRDVSPNVNQFRIVAEKDGVTAERTVERGSVERIEIAIRGVERATDLQLDMLFLLDTTGSMGDELNRIQETIDSIAQRIDDFTPHPELRFGLVAYRDRGDEYVTRTYDFTTDVDSFRDQLNALTADGGGDTPESVNEGLHQAVQGIQWRDNAVRLIFLVADAAPHLDYPDDYDYIVEAQEAVTRGIKIYPIAASNTDAQAEYVFRQLAQQTLAGFIFLTYQPGENGGVPGESTTLQAGDQAYTVEALDDLIVGIVERELAAAIGAR